MRRIFIVFFVLTAMLMPALAEAMEGTYVVSMGYENPILISNTGEQLTETGQYMTLYLISNEGCPRDEYLYCCMLKGIVDPSSEEAYIPAYALMDAQGNCLTDFAYEGLSHYWNAHVVVFYQDGLCGAMDEQGHVILAADYDTLVPNNDGGFLATPHDTVSYDADGDILSARLCHIAADGTQTDTELDVLYPYGEFQTGLLPVYISVGEIWQYGYINEQGELAIDAKFDMAEPFRGDYAIVSDGMDTFGMIRTDGSWAVEPIYNSIQNGLSVESRLIAKREGAVDFLDSNTLEVAKTVSFDNAVDLYGYEMMPGIFQIHADGIAYAMNMDGEVLFEIDGSSGDYISAYFVGEKGDRFPPEGQPNRMVLTCGDWPETSAYIIDLNQEKMAGPYQAVNSVWWQGTEGRFIFTECNLVELKSEDGGMYKIIRDDSQRYGLVDQDGNEIFPAKFTEMSYLGDGLYWVKEVENYGLIDEAGNWYLKISEYQELMD